MRTHELSYVAVIRKGPTGGNSAGSVHAVGSGQFTCRGPALSLAALCQDVGRLVAAFGLFVDDKVLVRKHLEETKAKRIAKQIEPDGHMARELTRSKAFDYSRFNPE